MDGTFPNRAAQLRFVFVKFVDFIGQVFLELRGARPPELELVKEAPVLLLCAKATNIIERWGEALDKEDMRGVLGLITEYSGGVDAEKVAQDGLDFVNYLEKNPTWKDKFFVYTRVMKAILS